MYAELLPALQCPVCAHGSLELLGPLEANGEIVAGALRCAACETQTAIRDGVWDALGDRPVPMTPAQITNYLPPTARAYEPLWRWTALSLMSGRHFPLREELTLLRALMQPAAGKLYVDVACSAGLYARALARPGTTVAAVDHSLPFCQEGRRLALERGLRISFIRASAQALPFADGAADGAVMGGSLNEIGNQHGALDEVRRILRTDGRFFCMNLIAARSALGRQLQRLLGTGGIEFPTLASFNRMADAARLRPRAQWDWGVVAITLLAAAE